jgi:hypothetical protein
MFKRTKLWTSMNLVTLVGAVAISGCDSSPKQDHASNTHSASKSATMAGHNPFNEGEGEGAEEPNAGMSDIEYLTQLGLMRGHLFVGYSLYKQGHIEHAKTHMKHPKSELYANLEPALKVRNAHGFADELEQLSVDVGGEKKIATVTAAYERLEAAIAKNESLVLTESKSVAGKLKLASALLRVAGEEYAIAVVDGKMMNTHEYQDALGFTHIAEVIVNGAKANGVEELAAVAKASGLISDLKHLWPGLIPPDTLNKKSSELYGAAAKVELLALGVE